MLEGHNYGTSGEFESPEGKVFGMQGFAYAAPIVRSITCFLDNTCLVADQYGKRILGVVGDDNVQVKFADSPPSANREGDVTPRRQFATHQQTFAALAAEGINWRAYCVRWKFSNNIRIKNGLTKVKAEELQEKLIKEGVTDVMVYREVAVAGWPQLSYDELMELDELPPTPESELRKIRDLKLRRDALRARKEYDEAQLALIAEDDA